MRIKHPIAQAVVIVVASLAIAVIANGFAGRTRQLKLPGWYPNATTAPTRAPQLPAPVPDPPVVATTATVTATATQAPVIPTTTTVAPTAPKPAPQPTQQPSNPGTQQPDLTKFTPHPDKPYVEISGDDAAALHRAGVLFLDARRSSVFEEGHIAGARSYSVWEADVDDKVNALLEERMDPADQNKPIVIYCSGGACEDSHMLAQKLWGVQFNNVYVYKDGFPDWQKRNLPVRKGANP